MERKSSCFLHCTSSLRFCACSKFRSAHGTYERAEKEGSLLKYPLAISRSHFVVGPTLKRYETYGTHKILLKIVKVSVEVKDSTVHACTRKILVCKGHRKHWGTQKKTNYLYVATLNVPCRLYLPHIDLYCLHMWWYLKTWISSNVLIFKHYFLIEAKCDVRLSFITCQGALA